MTSLQILARRFRRRFLGATYCTIETRSTHEFEVTGNMGFMLMCRCRKCELNATYDPITGLRA